MKVVIGSDKDGMKLKNLIKERLIDMGYEIIDKSEQLQKTF